MGGSEDKFRQTLIEEGLNGIVLVESKMIRGSTHNKDQSIVTRFMEADSLTEGLDDARADLMKDMWLKRNFDPEEFDTLEELEGYLRTDGRASGGAGD